MTPGVGIPGTGANRGTVGTPGQPAPGTAPLPGATTGAIGGVGPGVGGTGGTTAETALTPDASVSTPTSVQPNAALPQTGINGSRGAAAPGTGVIDGSPAARQRGVTTQPGVGIGETGTGTPADVSLSQHVRAQLLNRGLDMNPTTRNNRPMFTPQSLSSVEINANRGAITLNGSVRTEAERRLIENQIRQVKGVRSVVNRLVVNPAAVGTVGTLGTRSGVGGAASQPTPAPSQPQPQR